MQSQTNGESLARVPRGPLGNSGISVSRLGLGTVKLGRNEGVKYPRSFRLPDDREVDRLLGLTADLGINLIDTAPAYGSSEERLGRLLSRRKDWIICSKVGEDFNAGQSSFDFSAAGVRHSVERSLRRLRSDYLDIVLVHSDGRDEEIIRHSDCFEELARCREQGLIRSIGMSTKTVAGGLLAAQVSDVVMVTYNPQAREEEPVLDYAQQHGKGVLIKKALHSGHLPAADSPASRGPSPEDPVLHNMRFIFAHPGVSSIIIGSITPDHIRHNAHCAIEAIKPQPGGASRA